MRLSKDGLDDLLVHGGLAEKLPNEHSQESERTEDSTHLLEDVHKVEGSPLYSLDGGTLLEVKNRNHVVEGQRVHEHALRILNF